MYKELAKAIYEELFFPESNRHMVRLSLENAKDFISKNVDQYLREKIEKGLFRHELRMLIRNDYLIPSQKQDMPRMSEDLLQELHDWLNEDEPDLPIKSKIGHDPSQKPWLATDNALKLLAKYLIEENCLTKTDKKLFISIMKGTYKDENRIKWCSSSTLLIYLFDRLLNNRYFTKHIPLYSFIELNFVDKKEGSLSGVRQMIQNITANKTGKPRNHAMIDEILERSFIPE